MIVTLRGGPKHGEQVDISDMPPEGNCINFESVPGSMVPSRIHYHPSSEKEDEYHFCIVEFFSIPGDAATSQVYSVCVPEGEDWQEHMEYLGYGDEVLSEAHLKHQEGT